MSREESCYIVLPLRIYFRQAELHEGVSGQSDAVPPSLNVFKSCCVAITSHMMRMYLQSSLVALVEGKSNSHSAIVGAIFLVGLQVRDLSLFLLLRLLLS